MRATLLLGTGTGQNGMQADKQVDYGRMQVNQCRQGTQLQEDIKALGYEQLIEDIRQSTEALAEAAGRQASAKSSPKSVLTRQALRKAASEFLWVTKGIDDLLATIPDRTEEHDQLCSLRASLHTLLERYAIRSEENAEADSEPPEEVRQVEVASCTAPLAESHACSVTRH